MGYPPLTTSVRLRLFLITIFLCIVRTANAQVVQRFEKVVITSSATDALRVTGTSTLPVIVLTPGSQPASVEGKIYYDSVLHAPQVYNGTIWRGIGSTVLTGSDFANQGTTTTLLHGNASGNLSFGSVVNADLNVTAITCTNQFIRSLTATLTGSCSTVANADLANSSLTIAGHLVSLGGTQTLAASDLTNGVTGSGAIALGIGNVTNDAQTKATIVPNTAPSSGQVLIGNAGGTAYAPQTLSGSGATATLSSAGVLTLSAIANGTLSNSSVTISSHVLSLGGTLNLVSSDVSLGNVTNDAQTKAAIVPNTVPSAGQILVGNAGGTAYTPVTASGSGATITISSAGVHTISAIADASLINPQAYASVHPNTLPSAGQVMFGNAGGTAYAPQTISGSGATITAASTGVITISAIANASLANNFITIQGSNVALGGATLATNSAPQFARVGFGGAADATSPIAIGTGLGAITHLIGPPDQDFLIAATVPASGTGNGLTLSASAGATTSAGGKVTINTGNTGTGAGSSNPGDFVLNLGSQKESATTNARFSTGAFIVQGVVSMSNSSTTAVAAGANPWLWTGGAGQTTTGVAGTGGTGQGLSAVFGPGGNATANTGGIGGPGGPVSILSGNGGSATGVTSGTRNGGNSGDFTIGTGTPGTGASANGTAGTFHIQIGSADALAIGPLKTITTFAGITTSGLGVPGIYGTSATTGNSAAVSNFINYTPPATAGTYQFQAFIDVTAWSTPASSTVTCAYHDPLGNARTQTMALQNGSGTVAAAISATGQYSIIPFTFGIDNSATAIQCSTVTFTGTPTYSINAALTQVK